MAKRIVATLLLLMLVFTTVATAFAKTAVSGTRYVTASNGKPVNVRKGPGKSYALAALGRINVGEQVSLKYKDKDKNGAIWYMISYKGKTGWMMGSFLSTKKPSTGGQTQPTVPAKDQCGFGGCTAKATRTYGKWEMTNKRMADGSLKPVEIRNIHVTCEKGHVFGYSEERNP
ncbi:MAG: SH3 domain-containing protein [Clostridia bacterium]|nr:SH3 domain-containing protein [Clostridia bacterium]